MKTLLARVSIGRWTGGQGDGGVVICFTDDASGCVAAEVKMTVEEFGFAVTGLSDQRCEMLFNDSGIVGKRCEVKHEVITVSAMYPKEGEVARAVEPFEVDGWKATRRDFQNGHNYVRESSKDPAYRVMFTRFVEDSASGSAE